MASGVGDYDDLISAFIDPLLFQEEQRPHEQPSETLALGYDQAMRGPSISTLSYAIHPAPSSYRDNGSIGSPSSDGELQTYTPASGHSDGRNNHSPLTPTLRYSSAAQELALGWHSGNEDVRSTAAGMMNQFPTNSGTYPVNEHAAASVALSPELMDLEDEFNVYSPELMPMSTNMVLPHRSLVFTTPQQQHFQGQQYAPHQLNYHAHSAQVVQPLMHQQSWHTVDLYSSPPHVHGEQRFVNETSPAYVDYAQQHAPPSQPAQLIHPSPAQSTSRRVAAPTQAYHAYTPPRHIPRHQQILPHGAVALSTTATVRTIKKGGRKSRLSAESRAQVAKTRKAGACWRCVMQRDPCRGDGPCCERCHRLAVMEYPGMYVLSCDRTKLPVLLQDFLPASMTYVHQKQVVLNAMDLDAIDGVPAQGRLFTIWLTAGFGPDLSWPMVEFTPKDETVTTQFQFYQNPTTRLMEKRDKYSPPFAIKSLSQEEESFEQYLENILTSGKHLFDFAGLCYLAESRYETFQEEILTAMCTLYLHTEDENLQALLKRILRMLVLTNIMVHTLTIVESKLAEALDQLERSPAPPQSYYQKHTSPKLANRQLKFFFSTRREEIYLELLKYGQNTLRAGGDKDKTWIQMFVLILGFAMVHEEIQSILQIQAVSKAAKHELTWGRAQQEAVGSCSRIDQKFELLVALFQHKYRSDKWTSPGSFGNQTPTLSDLATNFFLSELRGLMMRNKSYLEDRKSTPLGHEQQCKYTSRLVARFLLPFLQLPQ